MTMPLNRIRLTFSDEAAKPRRRAAACLSGVEQVGETMFLVGDEGAWLHRLDPDGRGGYAAHERLDVLSLFGLDGDPDTAEADLEGLCETGGWLWMCGSHSRKRSKPDAAALDAFADTRLDRNRLLLGRLPIVEQGGGRTVVAQADDGRRAEHFALADGKKRTALTEAFKEHPLLGAFVKIPGKEGGLDIEGIVARGTTVMVGLRGPVLRGHAVIVRFEVTPRAGALLLSGGLDVRLLDIDGLGVRDLAVAGRDVLILAGPTMQLDGPSLVFRWHDAFADDAAVVAPANLERILDLPYGYRRDHAEGICVLARDGRPPRLMVAYDSPPDSRSDGGAYFADVFALPD